MGRARGLSAQRLLPERLGATLVLVRHGQSTFVAEGRFQGRLDPPLSALGERQARSVGAWLATAGGPPGLGLPAPPREIVHSPLRRVARTAEEIASAVTRSHALPPTLLRSDPRLVEIGVGAWEGLTLGEVDARWAELHAAWRRDAVANLPPGGETLSAASKRARGALPDLLDHLAHHGNDASPPRGRAWSIVVAHGGILRLLLFALLDLPLDRFWSFPFELAAVSVIDIDAGRASLRAHNLPVSATVATDEAPPESGAGLRTL